MPRDASSGRLFEAIADPVAVGEDAIESVAAPFVAPGPVSLADLGIVSAVVFGAEGIVVFEAEGIFLFGAEGILAFGAEGIAVVGAEGIAVLGILRTVAPGVVRIAVPGLVFGFVTEEACYPLCFVVVLKDKPRLVVHTASSDSRYPLALVVEDSTFPLSAARVVSHVLMKPVGLAWWLSTIASRPASSFVVVEQLSQRQATVCSIDPRLVSDDSKIQNQNQAAEVVGPF